LAASGLVSDHVRRSTEEDIMFTKTLIAALILATTSVALTSRVYAGPKGSAQHEQSYFDRASKVSEGGI
jgi:hypothetical protein